MFKTAKEKMPNQTEIKSVVKEAAKQVKKQDEDRLHAEKVQLHRARVVSALLPAFFVKVRDGISEGVRLFNSSLRDSRRTAAVTYVDEQKMEIAYQGRPRLVMTLNVDASVINFQVLGVTTDEWHCQFSINELDRLTYVLTRGSLVQEIPAEADRLAAEALRYLFDCR